MTFPSQPNSTMKKLLLFSLFSLSLYYFIANSPSPAAAQGTCTACLTSSAGFCEVDTPTSCQAGYTCPASTGMWGCPPAVTTICSSGKTTLTCVAAPAGGGTYNCGWVPVALGGWCQLYSRCTGGYTPPSGACSASTAAGCVPTTATACPAPLPPPPPVNVTTCPSAFGNGISTALGCVPTTLGGLVPWLLRSIVWVAGGLALLLLFYGGIMFITAGGDPKGVDEAKGIITAAVAGLLLILLSLLILRVIGINLLGLPAVMNTPGGVYNVPGT